MAQKSLEGVLQQVRKLAAVQSHRQLADRELLERFLSENDEAAFTVLVERYGPMVHRVCWRVLRNTHDADDACQAVFLVLVRKASSLRNRASLESWLHGIACRVAANLQRENARRRRRERGAQRPAFGNGAAEPTGQAPQVSLDDELQKLPERYRLPLMLCYLEGKSRQEAAQQLGVSAGRLHGLLERGRHLLRERLAKKGLTLSAPLLAAVLADSAAHAGLSPTLVIATTKAALLLAAGQALPEGVVAAHVLTLTQGVLQTMFLTKLKIGAAALACIALLAVTFGGALTSQSIAQDAKTPPTKAVGKSAQPKTESDADFIRRISKDLRDADPTPAEIHFFLTSKDPGRRQKLVDLFIQERQAKQAAMKDIRATMALEEGTVRLLELQLHLSTRLTESEQRNLVRLQKEFLKNLGGARDKGDVSKITQAYLDRLLKYVKENPQSPDLTEAMQQIVLVYESQDKTVEAGAWRELLRKEQSKRPKSTPEKTGK